MSDLKDAFATMHAFASDPDIDHYSRRDRLQIFLSPSEYAAVSHYAKKHNLSMENAYFAALSIGFAEYTETEND